MNNNRHCRKHICHIGWCVQFNLCSHLSKLMLRYISGSNFPIPEKIIHGIFTSVKVFYTWKSSFFQRITFSPSICIFLPIIQFTVALDLNLYSKYLYLTSNLSTYSSSICIFLPIFQFAVALDLYSKYLYHISNLSTYNGLSAYVSTLSFPAENFPRRCKQPF